MYYLPEYSTGQCLFVYDKDTLRVLDNKPVLNTPVDYTDYYINSNYYTTNGTIIYNDTMPLCISDDKISTDYIYRVDFLNIVLLFVLLVIICFYVPVKILFRFFRRFN